MIKPLRPAAGAIWQRSFLLITVFLTLAVLGVIAWRTNAQVKRDNDAAVTGDQARSNRESRTAKDELPGIDALALSPPTDAHDLTSLADSPLLNKDKSLQIEERFGVPTYLWAAPEDPGVHLQTSRDAQIASRRHLERYAAFYGLQDRDVAAAKIASVHDTGSGAIIVKFREQAGGIEVFREEISIAMDRDLRLIAISGYLSGASRKVSQQKDVTFHLTEKDAVARGLSDLAARDFGEVDLEGKGTTKGNYNLYAFGEGAQARNSSRFITPARAKKVYFHLPEGFVPAYYIELDLADVNSTDSNYYSYVISALDGHILFRNNLTASDAYGYRV